MISTSHEQINELHKHDLHPAQKWNAPDRLTDNSVFRNTPLELSDTTIMIALSSEIAILDVNNTMDDRIRTMLYAIDDDIAELNIIRADKNHDIPLIETIHKTERTETSLRDIKIRVIVRLDELIMTTLITTRRLRPPSVKITIMLHTARDNSNNRSRSAKHPTQTRIEQELDNHKSKNDIHNPAKDTILFPDKMPNLLQNSLERHAEKTSARL